MEGDAACRGSHIGGCDTPVVVVGFAGFELRQELLSNELVGSERSPMAGSRLFERGVRFADGGLLGVEAGAGGGISGLWIRGEGF